MTTTPIHQRRSLARLRKLPSWSVLAAGTLLGGLLGVTYGLVTPPKYTATSYVIAVPTDKAGPESALGFAQAYGRAATQLAVLGDAQVWARVPVRTLQHSVRTATSPDAPMVAVSATSSRPGLAVDMANAVSRALTRHADDTSSNTQVRLVQFSRAMKPTEPTSTSPAVTALVGASAGGLLCGLALLARPRQTRQDDDPLPAASVPGPAAAADVRGQR
ncbi:lipopolysaccharide biosynthesis protein [Streptomyces sp. PSKA30]|uniref:lipopolysaccharide biosynthesis protein n=1 Tax=Streptomyces sp. PSKA30 TaxID=2874597 RepID=UPI001CD0FAF1|nr:lipopolysaccharide biosynthesis protein [Streptomyces sp. PSKA30]MBZ9637949.1 lipopolysaccharide biosynthesis protein [Streptomyces sp. PSKA30]